MQLPFQSLINRVRLWPRWLQIAALGGALIVGWWICQDTVWSVAADYSRRANDLRQLLSRGQSQSRQGLRSVQDSVIAHGRVQAPRRLAEGSVALSEAATAVINAHSPNVSNFKVDARARQKLPQSALRGVLAPGQRAERVIQDVEFEAPPETVSSIIAALESNPAVDAISSVRLTRVDASRRLRVKLAIEAWVVEGAGRGAA